MKRKKNTTEKRKKEKTDAHKKGKNRFTLLTTKVLKDKKGSKDPK